VLLVHYLNRWFENKIDRPSQALSTKMTAGVFIPNHPATDCGEPMGTVTKALELLDLFTREQTLIGLSDLARLSGLNKATCFRMMTEMQALGLVEQTGPSKAYRLGPAVLRLAALREAAVPTRDAAMPVVQALAREVGETAHLSHIVGSNLRTLAFAYSAAHGTKVMMEDADLLPFHATSSGLAVLAFLPDAMVDSLLAAPLPAFTAATDVNPTHIRARLAMIRNAGWSETHATFEADVRSVAVPLFDATGACTGAIGIAAPAARVTPALHAQMVTGLMRAGSEITTLWGGQLPPAVKAAWAPAA
jgi:IclR family transcriptional regulator, acetate operon repressor